MRAFCLLAASLIGTLALAASPGVLAQDRGAPSQEAEVARDAGAPDRPAQGNNRGYVVGKGGVARASQGGNPHSDDLLESADQDLPLPAAQTRTMPEPVGSAAIGVNEPGVNRAPQGPQTIGVNEPGVN